MHFSIKTKITVLCSVFLLVFIPSTLFLLWSLRGNVEIFRHVVHDTAEVVAEAQLLGKLIVDMETGQRGFVITGKEEFLEPFSRANEEFDEVIGGLRKHLADRPGYLDVLERVEDLRNKWLGIAAEPEIEMRRLIGETEVSLKTIGEQIAAEEGKKILDSIRAVIDTITDSFRKAGRKDEIILITLIGKDVVDSETGQRGFLLAGEDRFLEPYYSGQVAFMEHTKELENLLEGDEKNLERLSDVKKLYEEWLVKAARPEIHARVVYEKDPRSMDDVIRMLVAGRGKGVIDQLREVIGKFTDDLTKEMEGELSWSERSATLANFIGLIVSGSGILVALCLAFFIGRAITNPIGVLIGGTSVIGKGDLTHKIRVKSKDELGVLADSFNKMTEDLGKSRDELTAAMDYTDNIIKSMIDTLIVVDPDGRIKTINKATSLLLGYKEDELIGKPVATIFAEEEEEEEEEVTPFFKGTKMKKLIEGGSIRDYDMTYKTKSSERIPVSFSGSVMRDRDGVLIGIVGIARDMREIKQLMQKEKELAAAAATAETEKKRATELEKAYKELREKSERLERFHSVAVDQELEMVRLEEEVNTLLQKLGQQRKYETPEKIKKSHDRK